MEDLENLNIDFKVDLARVTARRIFKLFPTGIKLTTWRNAAINQQKSTLKYLRVLSQPHPVQFTFRGLLVSTCDSLGKSAQNQTWQPCVPLHWLFWWLFVSFPNCKVSWCTNWCGGLRSNIERGSNLNLHARHQINWKSKDVKAQFILHQSPLLLQTTVTEFYKPTLRFPSHISRISLYPDVGLLITL